MRLASILTGIMVVTLLAGCASTGTRKSNPDKAAEANVQLGIAYFREGRMAIAMEKLQKALEQDPDSPLAHSAIAVVYQRLGEIDAAERHFKRALSLAPKDSKIHNNYGQLLCSQKRLAEADSHFMQAVANPLYETPESAYTNAGICAAMVPDPAKAEQYFRTALQKSPVYAPALYQMLKLSYEQQQFMRGRAYLQRYQAVARHNADTLWYGIRIEDALGDQNAVSSYGLLLKNHFPDARQTQEYLEWVNGQQPGN